MRLSAFFRGQANLYQLSRKRRLFLLSFFQKIKTKSEICE
nr:MAG TPA: hypothetical protein [Caudoviricetes sp.]